MSGSPVTPAEPRIEPLGDRALVIRLGQRIDDETFRRVRAALARLEGSHPAIIDVVAGFTTVTVHYDPAKAGGGATEPPYAALTRTLEQTLGDLPRAPAIGARLVAIPVCYAGDLAPDLEDVARHAGLSTDQVVTIHSGATYTVHMIGFTPGFPYLGGLDPCLATPRRAEPRTRVPAGSVAIGGEQAGVYPMATPGGWNIIGRTHSILFDPMREPLTLLRVGDRVRFVPITREQFDSSEGAWPSG